MLSWYYLSQVCQIKNHLIRFTHLGTLGSAGRGLRLNPDWSLFWRKKMEVPTLSVCGLLRHGVVPVFLLLLMACSWMIPFFFNYPHLWGTGKVKQSSSAMWLCFPSAIFSLSPELAIILELMSGFCALELGICFKSLTEKHEGNSFCRVPLANALKIKFNVSSIHGNKSGQNCYMH